MKKKKFCLSDFDICDYKLIGIHSQLEPHKIAYLINSKLDISFNRMEKDLDLKLTNKIVSFPIFEYFNQEWDTKSFLICNKVNDHYIDVPSSNLFTEEDLVQVEYVLKDHKRVDYLMKIDDELNIFDPQIIIDKLSSIKQILMAYTIESKKIKYPEHLILE
jgi:hypothetical protein